MNFEHLESLDCRKRQFQSANSTFHANVAPLGTLAQVNELKDC
jgi:hypothetical protein